MNPKLNNQAGTAHIDMGNGAPLHEAMDPDLTRELLVLTRMIRPTNGSSPAGTDRGDNLGEKAWMDLCHRSRSGNQE